MVSLMIGLGRLESLPISINKINVFVLADTIEIIVD